jgi:hypothetical protein
VSDNGLREELVARRIRLLSLQGRPLEALDAATALLRDVSARERTRVHAAGAAAEALLARGQFHEAIALVEIWQPISNRHRDELPFVEPGLTSVRSLALWLAGRLVEATELTERDYETQLARPTGQYSALVAGTLGFIWLARGRVHTALRWFREGAALLHDADELGMLPWTLAGFAQPELAGRAVEEMQRTPLGYQALHYELGLARAWSAAAAGELSQARRVASDTADLAQSRGQTGFAVRALHELCRLGEPATAAPQLAHLAGHVDGLFVADAAEHAAALVAGDGRALLQVGARFADQGALLLAAEAAEAAAAAFDGIGRESSARAAAGRAASGCRIAKTPRRDRAAALGPAVD